MGGMMMLPHPIHMHGQQFRIISRKLKGGDMDSYATVRDGFINSGWKDTVLVMPSEEIDVIKPSRTIRDCFSITATISSMKIWGMMRNFYVS
jgi:suppressor of ftsI/bilirubin oxidase